MSPSGNRLRPARSASASEDTASEPPGATGRYPDPVWAAPSPVVTAKSQGRSGDGGRGPVRMVKATRHSAGWSKAAGEESTIGAPSSGKILGEPASATGRYPDPVWAWEPPLVEASQAPRAARALTDAPVPTLELPAPLKALDYSDDLAGTVPADEIVAASTTELTNDAIYRIIREVAVAESGEAAYAAVSLNDEHSATERSADHRRQFGLGFGLLLWTQESGRLGRVLALTRQRDPAVFAGALGPDAESVLAVTNAGIPEQRLQPVGGELLWSPTWADRFRRLGQAESCQYAQNEEAIEGLFRPMWRIAEGIGITSERGLAMLFDRVVTGGLGGGLRWALRVAGPLRSAKQRTFALQTLGFETLQDFQASVADLPADGSFGVETYGALVAALRDQGLVSLPAAAEYVARLYDAAQGVARNRLARLRDSSVLRDVIYHAS